ncbi:hypothetical protein PG996_002677 [Apiospora saccharicola]|uniref:Uncharacterized protein n=1 Tax=Apiospora saccharicola TaxID=335842 RepID=A0ABR1WK67_9PEZI
MDRYTCRLLLSAQEGPVFEGNFFTLATLREQPLPPSVFSWELSSKVALTIFTTVLASPC